MSQLSIINITKSFGSSKVVNVGRVDIPTGQFFSILGPSGCGKTTLLRIIAGFESPTIGRVLIGGKDITGLAPQERGIGMVFQNYALFPHMNVFDNVAFGLAVRNISDEEMKKRVRGALGAVDLIHKIDVPVPQLSGGEQQRVAVARALVLEPTVLLFDEPLSNLDVSLRIKTREEIRAIQRRTGITSIYVTHDQEEAMSLSDRIAVMRSGTFEQVGAPEEVYENPLSPFVARFLGGANLIHGHYSGNKHFAVGSFEIFLQDLIAEAVIGKATLCIKPEAITLHEERVPDSLPATIREREYLGFTTSFIIDVQGIRMHASMVSTVFTNQLAVGATIQVRVATERVRLFSGWSSD